MATFQVVHMDIGPAPGIFTAFIERALSTTGPWTRLGSIGLIDGEGYFYDNTAPYDVPVWYRVVLVIGGLESPRPELTGPLTLVGAGTVVLSDPNRPWADIEFGFCANAEQLSAAACNPTGPEFIWARFDPRLRRHDAGLFDRLDSETPADIYARRKDWESGARFITKTLAAIDQVYELFTVGGPLYLRAPTAYGIKDVYIQPRELLEEPLSETIDQRFPHRVWTFPYTVVDPVLAVQQGTDCANWCAVQNAFPTFADLTATGDTWADVATGVTVCP
ncbi:hypothetical protein AB0B30_32455 [Streptomyces narbonensis]|uniref:Minor tail protein n=1 Tax=Streptomyces narbonensis TaxID=67333 RepID=A0ABV3CIZ0_9ACTN